MLSFKLLLVFRPWNLLASATAGLLKDLPFPGALYQYQSEQLFGENSWKSEEFAFQKQQACKHLNAILPSCSLPGS